MEKKTRHKRAAKEEPSPPKVKRIKVSQEQVELYDKFVVHSRKLKRAKRGQKATEDVLCLYHAFFSFSFAEAFFTYYSCSNITVVIFDPFFAVYVF
jgi:hypothetical protein